MPLDLKRMTLSKFLVLESKDFNWDELTFEQTKIKHRELTRKWMSENQEFEGSMKQHYKEVTGEEYHDNKEAIYDGYSDHYSEKIYVFSNKVVDVKKELQKIIYKEEDLDKIRKGVENKSILGFIGHLGGMEFIPTFFADLGIPVTVMLRFKSDLARKMAQEQIERYEGLDFNMIDVGGELYRNFRKFLTEKRLLITVFDGFDNWQINRKSEQVSFAGRDILLDSTPKRLHSLTGKGSVYYLSMIRKGNEYHLNVEEIPAEESEGLPTEIYSRWSDSVLTNPNQWYIWDEVEELFEIEQ